MTSGAVAVFVKTPGLSPLKTRLGESIGKNQAEKFHALSCRAVAAVIKEVKKQVTSECTLVPYWAVAEPKGLAHSMWSDFEKVNQGDGGLGDRLASVYEQLLRKYDFAVFIGGDSPQMSATQISNAIKIASSKDRFALGMAEDGGFYLFAGGKPIGREVWTSIPYSDWQTGSLFKSALEKIAPVQELATVFDVDTDSELKRLKKLLASRNDLLPEQKEILKWLEMIRLA